MLRLMTRALAAIGLLWVIITATPLVRWWGGWLTGRWEAPSGDTLLLLTGGELTPGVLGLSSYLRAAYGVMTWREAHGQFRQIVIAGKGVSVDMRNYLVGHGVPAAVIQVENESLTTHESAMFFARQYAASAGTVVLLTSDYHTRRAAAAFARAGVPVRTVPLADAAKRVNNPLNRWSLAIDLATETIKFGYYYVKGWL